MDRTLKLALASITAFFLAALAAPANATVITGEFWDVAARSGNPITSGFPTLNQTGGSYLATVDAIIASRSADATFQSSGIAYPSANGNSATNSTTLAGFLGADAATLSPDLSGTLVLGSIMRFTGMVDLVAGNNVFSIYSDDGFRLSIDGAVIFEFDGLRAPSSSMFGYSSASDGLASFELVYFEAQQVLAAVTARLNGDVIGPLAVPEPSTLALLGVGLLGLGLTRRRRAA